MKAAPQEWQDTLATLQQALATLQAGTQPPATLHAMVKEAHDKDTSGNRMIYIFGQLDAAKAVLFAKAGDIAWWPVLTGRAFFNDPDGLQKVFDAMPADKRVTGANNAYAWVAEPYEIVPGVENSINGKIIRQLMEFKANPNEDKGKWLEKSLRTLDSDSIRALIDFGAAPATVFRVMGELQEKKNFEQAGKIQDALARDPVYFKIDTETLMESKYIPGADGGATLKAVFNFKSRRVNEVYEGMGADRRTAMTSVSFDDYDAAAIGFAEEQLRKLGGSPPDALHKPKLAKLGG